MQIYDVKGPIPMIFQGMRQTHLVHLQYLHLVTLYVGVGKNGTGEWNDALTHWYRKVTTLLDTE